MLAGSHELTQILRMELATLERDVYACLQPDRGFGWSNSGFVNRGGGMVVDTFWDVAHTRRLSDLYATVAAEPPKRVVNTHHNGDHCWGNQVFAGAEIIAHRLCAEHFEDDGNPAMLQGIKVHGAQSGDPAIEWFARELAEWDFSDVVLTPPTRVFDGRLEIDLDGLKVVLVHVGPAHTPGDLVVHLPERGVVFAGDVLFRLCTPVAWQGSFDQWIRALHQIRALEPQIIVPGHGPLSKLDALDELAAYFVYVRERAREAYDANLPLVDACRRIDLGPYAGWTQPERIVFNVARAYREFRGEPYDAPIDAVALMRAMHALRGSEVRTDTAP